MESQCKSECDKSCDSVEYLDYANCKCRSRLTDKLVEKCDEDNDGNKMIHNVTLYNYEKECKSCVLYVVLFIIAFIIIIAIRVACLYFYRDTIKNGFSK